MKAPALAILVALLLAACAPTASGPPTEAPDGAIAAQLFGPWSANPFGVPPAIAAAVDGACRTFQRDADMDFQPGQAMVVIDVRGAGVAQVWYAGPNGVSASCQDVTLDPAQAAAVLGGGSSSSGGGPQVAVAPNSILVIDRIGSGVPGVPVEKSYVSGKVGAGITRVQIEQPGRAPVVATIGRGWFAAWFPGEWAPRSFVVGYDVLGIEQAREEI